MIRTRIGDVPVNQSDIDKLPFWVIDPFVSYFKREKEAFEVLHLCMEGINILHGMPNLPETLRQSSKVGGILQEDNNIESDKKIMERVEIAKREVQSGFPLLHAQSLISLCGLLEDLIRTFLLAWLANDPNVMKIPEIQKMKIELGKYEAMDTEDRYNYILEMLRNALGIPLKSGNSGVHRSGNRGDP